MAMHVSTPCIIPAASRAQGLPAASRVSGRRGPLCLVPASEAPAQINLSPRTGPLCLVPVAQPRGPLPACGAPVRWARSTAGRQTGTRAAWRILVCPPVSWSAFLACQPVCLPVDVSACLPALSLHKAFLGGHCPWWLLSTKDSDVEPWTCLPGFSRLASCPQASRGSPLVHLSTGEPRLACLHVCLSTCRTACRHHTCRQAYVVS